MPISSPAGHGGRFCAAAGSELTTSATEIGATKRAICNARTALGAGSTWTRLMMSSLEIHAVMGWQLDKSRTLSRRRAGISPLATRLARYMEQFRPFGIFFSTEVRGL